MKRLTEYGRVDFFEDYKDVFNEIDSEMRSHTELVKRELSEERVAEMSKVERYRTELELNKRHLEILAKTEVVTEEIRDIVLA